jgi:hypothetical protein
MHVICKVCDGKGKVDKDFAMGKCKELDPKEYFYRECPACNGTGMQYERATSFPQPFIFPVDPCRKKRRHPPFDPCPKPPWRWNKPSTYRSTT